MTKAPIFFIGFAALMALSGCPRRPLFKSNCATLDERMCSDLGTEDCAIWHEDGWDKSLIPSDQELHRERVCGALLDVYPDLFKRFKEAIADDKVRKAAEKWRP